MSNGAINHLVIDERAVANAIREYLYKAADNVIERLKEAFQIEVMMGGAGKAKWREEAGQAFKQIERIITEDYIECLFGVDGSTVKDEDQRNRIQVAFFGNQANGNIRSKPGGWVYGDTMENDLHLSTALTNYDIPQFDQTADGYAMMENAISLCQKYFKDALDEAARNIPDEIFYGNVNVIGG